MDFVGMTAADRPDPGAATRDQVTGLGIQVAGLAGQPHVEDIGTLGLLTSAVVDAGGEQVRGATVSRSYTLWRNPTDRSDPANLLVRDDDGGQRTGDASPGDLPGWMLHLVDRMRYPFLWEAVQTHWSSDGSTDPVERLVEHLHHVLHNRFRAEHALPADISEPFVELVTAGAARSASVTVDGAARQGIMIDTDPFVVGLAAVLDDGRVLTAVLPREELHLVDLSFASSLPL